MVNYKEIRTCIKAACIISRIIEYPEDTVLNQILESILTKTNKEEEQNK